MWLKSIIVILFIGLVISLFTSLGFLFNDRNNKVEAASKTRGVLSIRLVLAALLIICLFYGVFTGQLGSNAPWDVRHEDHSQNSAE